VSTLLERLRQQEREDWRGYRPPGNALCGEAADALERIRALAESWDGDYYVSPAADEILEIFDAFDGQPRVPRD